MFVIIKFKILILLSLKNPIFYILHCLVILFISCSGTKIISYTETDIQLTDSIKASHFEIYEIIEPFKEHLEKSMSEVLNISDLAMKKPERDDQSSQNQYLLGNFVADLSFNVGQDIYTPKDSKPIDFCVLNNGGLRTSLPKGEITRGKAYELMPFENQLVVLTLSGASTKKLLDYIIFFKGIPMSNISISVNQNDTSNIFINGAPFDIAKSYKVITSDYLANGGDKMTFFSEHINYEVIGIKLRDAIIKHIENEKSNGRNITSSLDKRITIIE